MILHNKMHYLFPALVLGTTVFFINAATATDYYVACQSGDAGGNGSANSPWTQLAQANAVTLQPGDNLLFAKGHTCIGSLQPKGVGNAQAPINIMAYGEGTTPVIDGNAAHDAVLLSNMAYLTLRDLEITNAAQPGSERNGVHVDLIDFGISEGITLQNLNIHDVRGGDYKKLTGSAGILISVSGTKQPSWYNNLKIVDNHLKEVDREGIYFKSVWNQRKEVGTQDTSGIGPWTPSTGVVIQNNQLSSIAGDGIKIDTTSGALIDGNTLSGFQLRSNENNAGIWTFNTNDSLVQNNDVSGGGNSHDGMSFDADGASINTLFQYNYSHNNAGGLLLICPYSGAVTNGTIFRYNISYNDKARLFQACPGEINNTQVYNNTIYHDGSDTVQFWQNDNSPKVSVNWQNNILYNTGPQMLLANIANQSLSFSNNDFVGIGQLPANPDGQTNPGGLAQDPLFVGVTESDTTGFKLQSGSPVIGKGAIILNNGGRDYYGNPVSDSVAPNMGAYEGVVL